MDTATRIRLIGDATVAEFARGLRGSVHRPGDPGYDEARTIWNPHTIAVLLSSSAARAWPT